MASRSHPQRQAASKTCPSRPKNRKYRNIKHFAQSPLVPSSPSTSSTSSQTPLLLLHRTSVLIALVDAVVANFVGEVYILLLAEGRPLLALLARATDLRVDLPGVLAAVVFDDEFAHLVKSGYLIVVGTRFKCRCRYRVSQKLWRFTGVVRWYRDWV